MRNMTPVIIPVCPGLSDNLTGRIVVLLITVCMAIEVSANTLYAINAADIPHNTFVAGGLPPSARHSVVQLKGIANRRNPQQLNDYNIFVSVRLNIASDPPPGWGAQMTIEGFQHRVVTGLEDIAQSPNGYRALNKFKHNPNPGKRNFALYIFEMSSSPSFRPRDIAEFQGYAFVDPRHEKKASRRSVWLGSKPGSGTSANIALKGNSHFFSAQRGYLLRLLSEEFMHSHRFAWGVSPPKNMLSEFAGGPGDYQLPLQHVIDELESSADLPSQVIVDPNDSQNVVFNYRVVMTEIERNYHARGEALGEFGETTGYSKRTADQWIDSIYLENGDRRLPVGSWQDRKAVKAFLAGSSRLKLQRIEENLDGLARWSSELSNSLANQTGMVSVQALADFNQAVFNARVSVLRYQAFNCGCLASLC